MDGNYKIKSEWHFISTKKGTELKILFECDPALNTECKKTNCGECKFTTNEKFAKRFDILE